MVIALHSVFVAWAGGQLSGELVLNKVLCGEVPTQGLRPSLSVHKFWKNGTPFVYLSLKKVVLLHNFEVCSFEEVYEHVVFPFSIYCLLKLLTIICKMSTIIGNTDLNKWPKWTNVCLRRNWTVVGLIPFFSKSTPLIPPQNFRN